MTAAHVIGAGILAGTWLVCAGALVPSRRWFVALMLAAGGLTIVVWLLIRSPSSSAHTPAVLVGMLFAPLAVLAYPAVPSTRAAADRRAVVAAATTVAAVSVVALTTDGHGSAYLPMLSVSVVVLHLWWRFERLGPAERRPLIWLVLGLFVCATIAFATAFVLPHAPQIEALMLASLGIPAVCMVIGVRRPDIVDATGIVVEATVLGMTALACLALYVTASSLLTVAAGRGPGVGIQAVLAVVVGAAFHWVRTRLHSTVDELLFGRRPDPIAAVAGVAGSPALDTATILDRIRRALVLPYAAIRTSRTAGVDVVVSGVPSAHTRAFPLRAGGVEDGEEVLVTGLRPGDLQFSRADTEVLGLVARLLGQMRRSEALATQLAQSRTAIRGAIEEERRRLRRDLHDGLGPLLTGMAYIAEAVTNLTRTDSAQVHELLHSLQTSAGEAIADIRRIVDDLRPPALDQLGLRGALARSGAVLGRADLEVVVEVDDSVGDLPAALEVTAYRIVTEALTNAARHTSATRIVVELRRQGMALQVSVRDDGASGCDEWSVGVGLTSMRERTEEVGGTLDVGPTPAGGLVEARLPLA